MSVKVISIIEDGRPKALKSSAAVIDFKGLTVSDTPVSDTDVVNLLAQTSAISAEASIRAAADVILSGLVSLTNKTGGTVSAGDIVRISSATEFTSALAGSFANCGTTVGVARETILNDASGTIKIGGSGEILSVTGYSLTPGLPVYLDTSLAGKLTQTCPTAQGHCIVNLGSAVSASSIEFNPADAVEIIGYGAQGGELVLVDSAYVLAAVAAEASIRAANDNAGGGSASVDAEASIRSAVDGVLQANIVAEASIRSAVDGVLQANIVAEASIRSAVDMTSEASIRSAADSVLQANIIAEASIRSAADVALQNYPFRMYGVGSDALLHVEGSTILKSDGTDNVTITVSGSVNLQTGAITGSIASPLTMPSSTTGYYRRICYALQSDNKIAVTFTADADNFSGVSGPVFTAGNALIGYADIVCTGGSSFKTKNSAMNIVENYASGNSMIHNIGLHSSITAEASVRSAADGVLQANITAEASIRSAVDATFARLGAAQTFTGIQTFSSMPVFSAGIQTQDIVGENTANAGLTLRVSATGTAGARIIYFGAAGAMGQVSQATTAWTFQGTTTHKAGVSIDATTATNNYLQFATGGTAATGAITYTTTTGMNFNNGGLVVADNGKVTATTTTGLSHTFNGNVYAKQANDSAAGLYTAGLYGRLAGNIYENSGLKAIGTGKAALWQAGTDGTNAFIGYADNTSRSANDAVSLSEIISATHAGAWTLGAVNTATRHTLQGATTSHEPIVKINNASNTATAGGLTIHSGAAGGTGASLYVGTYNDGAQLLHISPTHTAVRLTNASTASAVYYNTSTQEITYASSSARFKDNIRDSSYGLTSVLALQSRMFEYKYDGRTDIGLIAEEVYPVVPELIGLDKDGVIEAVDYSKFVSVLVKAVQELNAKVVALEARIV